MKNITLKCFPVNTFLYASWINTDQLTVYCLIKFKILWTGGICPKTALHCQQSILKKQAPVLIFQRESSCFPYIKHGLSFSFQWLTFGYQNICLLYHRLSYNLMWSSPFQKSLFIYLFFYCCILKNICVDYWEYQPVHININESSRLIWKGKVRIIKFVVC